MPNITTILLNFERITSACQTFWKVQITSRKMKRKCTSVYKYKCTLVVIIFCCLFCFSIEWFYHNRVGTIWWCKNSCFYFGTVQKSTKPIFWPFHQYWKASEASNEEVVLWSAFCGVKLGECDLCVTGLGGHLETVGVDDVHGPAALHRLPSLTLSEVGLVSCVANNNIGLQTEKYLDWWLWLKILDRVHFIE